MCFLFFPQVLWYRLDSGYFGSASRACKVDVLQPGIMSIPDVPTDKIKHRGNYPVMPLIPLILLKLQAWEDHENAFRSWQREKSVVDLADLGRLLPIASRRGDHVCGALSQLFHRGPRRVVRLVPVLVVLADQVEQCASPGARPVS